MEADFNNTGVAFAAASATEAIMPRPAVTVGGGAVEDPQEQHLGRILRRRIDDYFVEHNLSPKADGAMKIKIFLGLTVWAAGFVFLYSPPHQLWNLAIGYFLLAIAQTFLVLNVAHDSIHGAVSGRPRVNRLFAYVYDGCGVSSYLVRILHNQGHHYCINLYGEDDPLEGRHVFRFTRSAERKWYHGIQHLYAPLMYALFSIDYVFVRDFEDLFFPAQPCLQSRKHRVLDYAIVLGGKALYLSCLVLLPIFYLHYSVMSVIVGFLLMHVVIGFTVAVAFAPTHILGCNDFPLSGDEYEDFVHHIFATTADFAIDSPVVTWLIGGLNHHIVHHICPQVCHTHYRQLTKIVRQTAADFDIPYKHHSTMSAALHAHISFLKQLGSAT